MKGKSDVFIKYVRISIFSDRRKRVADEGTT